MTAVLYLYGDISQTMAAEFLSDLRALPASAPVTIAINSRGGSILAGDVIFAAIRRHSGPITARVDALAASAASYIAMAADRIVMTMGAYLMIHNPYAEMVGDASTLENVLVRLREIEGRLAAAYAQRCGLPVADVLAMMKSETWFSAEEAVAANFADEVDMLAPVAKSIIGTLASFKHPPPAVLAMAERAAKPPRPPRTPAQRARLKKRIAIMRSAATSPHDRASLDRAAAKARISIANRIRAAEVEAQDRAERAELARQGEAQRYRDRLGFPRWKP